MNAQQQQQPAQPRRFASLFPPAKHLAYASDMLRLREQRAAERARTGGAK